MSKLQYLVLHCTATPEGREVSKQDIIDWHIKGRGWSVVGYRDLIQLDGTIVNLVKFDQDDQVDPWEVTNGALGYNGKSHHVVYSGGCAKTKPEGAKYLPAKDTRTPAQKAALSIYVKYMIARHPDIKVIGHNQISLRPALVLMLPCWLQSIGVDSKNIGL